MPLFAGFDIGILNLAFCIIDSTKWKEFETGKSNDPGIICWENLNLLDDTPKCKEIIKSGSKKGQVCDNNCKWQIKINDIDNYFCGKHKVDNCKKYKQLNSKSANMNTLKKIAFQKLDEYEIFNNVVSIALESQPRINQQMKMFGASIEAYFIIRQYIDNKTSLLRSIKASPAKNKLKLYTGPPINCSHIKNPYDKRKFLAQKQVEYFLKDAPIVLETMWTPQKKKDDLADAFLHCLCNLKQYKK